MYIITLLFMLYSLPKNDGSQVDQEIPRNKTYEVMRSLLGGVVKSEKRKTQLLVYANEFEKCSKKYDLDLDLILSVGYVESGFRHIQNRKYPYDSGVLQVLPRDGHIQNFLKKNYGVRRSRKTYLKRHRIAAIRAGCFELDFYRKEWKRYIRRRHWNKISWRWKTRMRPMKYLGENKRIRKSFFFISYYNWGPRFFYEHKIHKFYPIVVMHTYRKIQRFRKKNLIFGS